jgi:hypothetical protein
VEIKALINKGLPGQLKEAFPILNLLMSKDVKLLKIYLILTDLQDL